MRTTCGGTFLAAAWQSRSIRAGARWVTDVVQQAMAQACAICSPQEWGGADFPVATSYPSNVARGGVYGRAKCSLPGRRARDEAISGEEMGGVENRRSGVSLPVAHNAA